DALLELASGTALARLRHLSVTMASLNDESIAAGLAAAPLDALVSLDLSDGDLSPDGLARLAASPRLRGLRRLILRHNHLLGDAGARTLAGSRHLRGLLALDLFFCGIGPRGARALAASPNLSGLLSLEMSGNQFGPAGVRAIVSSP